MASFVDGAEALNEKLKHFSEHFADYMDPRIEAGVQEMQQVAADLVPVDTGQGREGILMPDAIKRQPRTSRTGPVARWTFGLALSKAQAALTYYLFWREFGTKGYTAGDERSAGVYKRAGVGNWRWVSAKKPRDEARNEYREAVRENGSIGLQARLTDFRRYQKVKVNIPARPATPFFRPAVTEFMVRLRQQRALAKIYAAALTASGLNGGSRD